MEEVRKHIESLIEEKKVWKGLLHLSHTKENEEKILKLFNRFPSFVITREGGGLPGKTPSAEQHYHFFNVLDISTYKLESFKAEIREIFPNLKRVKKEGESKRGGGHGYTVGPPKINNREQYKNHLTELDQLVLEVCYTCKDVTENNIPLMKTYNIEQVLNIRDLYFKLMRVNNDLKIKQNSIETNERQSIVKKLIQDIEKKNQIIGADGQKHFVLPTQEEVIEIVCQHFIKGYKTMNQNVIANICETILVILDKQYYKDYKENIKNKISL